MASNGFAILLKLTSSVKKTLKATGTDMRYFCKDFVFEWFDMTSSILVRILILSREVGYLFWVWMKNKNLIFVWLARIFLFDVSFLTPAEKCYSKGNKRWNKSREKDISFVSDIDVKEFNIFKCKVRNFLSVSWSHCFSS